MKVSLRMFLNYMTQAAYVDYKLEPKEWTCDEHKEKT